MMMVVPLVVVVPSVHMSRLDIPNMVVVMTIHIGWKVWCITDLRVHRGCVVGRGSLHRSGRGSGRDRNKAGEEKSSKELHGRCGDCLDNVQVGRCS